MARQTKKDIDLYQSFFDSSEAASIIAGEDGTITHANNKFIEFSGFKRSEIVRKRRWPDLVLNGNLARMKQHLEFTDPTLSQPALSADFKFATKNGTIKDVFITRNNIQGTRNTALSFIDITDFITAGKKVSLSEEKYRLLIESTEDSVYMVDRDGTYIFVNKQVLARLCVAEANIIGKRYADFHNVQDSFDFFSRVGQVFESGASSRYEHKSLNGDRCMLRTLSPIIDPATRQVKFVAVVSKDISDLKKTEQKLTYLSLHDPLTNLYNRAYFEEEMHRLDNSRFELVGLIMCDIDGLKLINDTLGHDKGDELLATASTVIRKSFRENDVVARVGGDEFAILLPNSPRSKVEEMCFRIKSSVAEHNRNNPYLPLGISTGFSVRTGPEQSMAELYREADNNMYREKLFGSQRSRSIIVKNLLATIEDAGIITRNSAKRLRQLVTVLGNAVGLSEKRIKDLVLLAQFHDIGNISIHHRVILKEGGLTSDEMLEMRKHCDIGHRIAQSAANLTHIAEFILKHHEWWNGLGYPLGLAGEEIPIESRIMAIADAYEAMTGGRPYRKAITKKEALKELKKCAGTQFDPELIDRFIALVQ